MGGDEGLNDRAHNYIDTKLAQCVAAGTGLELQKADLAIVNLKRSTHLYLNTLTTKLTNLADIDQLPKQDLEAHEDMVSRLWESYDRDVATYRFDYGEAPKLC